MSPPAELAASGFARLPGWAGDDHRPAYRAFRRSALRARDRAYRTGSLGIGAETFEEAYAAARAVSHLSRSAARAFFERYFRVYRVGPPGEGFVTGFYEPVLPASATRTARFAVPLLSVPADLVAMDAENRPPGIDPDLAFGRCTGNGIVEYFDRAAIEGGALDGRGLALAWLEDKVEAFFVHVQGAAMLRMVDGGLRRLTYAAKSGHRFTGPGGVLAALGELPREAITAQAIRAWLRANPRRIDEILHRNRSYIFFRETEIGDPEAGPVAAAKVQLEPGRSIAVDRTIHTFGTPFFVVGPTLDAFGAAPFRRLMIAQDTGSAIVGPARGDLFTGSGEAAGEIAGVIRHPADFFVLVPAVLADRWSA